MPITLLLTLSHLLFMIMLKLLHFRSLPQSSVHLPLLCHPSLLSPSRPTVVPHLPTPTLPHANLSTRNDPTPVCGLRLCVRIMCPQLYMNIDCLDSFPLNSMVKCTIVCILVPMSRKRESLNSVMVVLIDFFMWSFYWCAPMCISSTAVNRWLQMTNTLDLHLPEGCEIISCVWTSRRRPAE